MKVSVIIPTYNRREEIFKCIDYILAQTHKVHEIIIVDDSPKPISIEKYGLIVKHIKPSKRAGLGGGKNIGIKNATGDYILVLDDDMYIEKDYVEKLLDAYKRYKDYKIGAAGGYLIIPNPKHNKIINLSGLSSEVIFDMYGLKGEQFVKTIHSNCLFPIEAFKDVGYFDEILFTGNYMYLEPDFFKRMQLKRYKLLYVPSARAIHNHSSGGTRAMKRIKYTMNTWKNARRYIWKFYGLGVIYLWPLHILEKVISQAFFR